MKQALDDAAEKLEALGQDSEKTAVSDARKIFKDEEQTHAEQENRNEEYLKKIKTSPIASYNRALATLLQAKLMGIEWEPGWAAEVFPTDEGVVLELNSQSPTDMRMFRSAFKPTMMEKYDLNAVNTYVVRAENTMDRVMHRDAAHNNVPTQ